MARQKPLLTDQQWAKIKPLLLSERPGPKGGRPRCNNRKVLEGIRWVLKTGARWRDLPPSIPSPITWLGNFRRLVVRYEHKLQIYSAFFRLACIIIALRTLLTWF